MNFTFFLVFFIINENKLKILARNSLYQHLKSTKKKKNLKRKGLLYSSVLKLYWVG
jgi:hypothetical protein